MYDPACNCGQEFRPVITIRLHFHFLPKMQSQFRWSYSWGKLTIRTLLFNDWFRHRGYSKMTEVWFYCGIIFSLITIFMMPILLGMFVLTFTNTTSISFDQFSPKSYFAGPSSLMPISNSPFTIMVI